MCCGKYSNRRIDSVETCTGRDGLALPREIEEGFLIHIPAEERRRQRKILEKAPRADGTLCANIGNPSSLGEVWGKVLHGWTLGPIGD